MITKLVTKRHALDAVNGLATATEAMETLLDIDLSGADAEGLRSVERVCNLAELASQLQARLQAKLVRETGLQINPLVPLKDRGLNDCTMMNEPGSPMSEFRKGK